MTKNSKTHSNFAIKMKTSIYRAAIAAAIATGAAAAASAQDTRSGYFVDEYSYRFQMNPAIANDRGFVSMPALSNLNLGVKGNFGLQDVLYNVDGRTTTFLHPGISAKEVLGNLHTKNRIGFDMRENILAVGFKAFKGYNTISIAARSEVNAHLPKSIFSLLKEGPANRTYNISDLTANAMAWAEVSLGHSHQVTQEWRVGANLKFLVGLGAFDADLKTADLTLGTDSWRVRSNATIHTSLKGMYYKMATNSHTGHQYVEGIDGDFSAPNGFGMALDLGAVYSPKALPDWSFSAALTDLGFISWSDDLKASTNGLKTFDTSRYTFNASDDALNNFDDQMDKIRDDLSALYELETDGKTGSRTQMLGATMNLGARYTFPLYRKLNFGLLNTTRIQGKYTWTDFRLSANVAPCKVFSAGINASAGTFGMGFGWMLNLHAPGFGLFLAMDNTLGKVSKEFIPLNSNASFSMGINFHF